jgi:hypothetical protein
MTMAICPTSLDLKLVRGVLVWCARFETDLYLDELRQLATEVRDFVQNKIGSSEFSRTWEDIRKRSGSKREERRDAKHRMVSIGIKAHQLC